VSTAGPHIPIFISAGIANLNVVTKTFTPGINPATPPHTHQ
jgi:hypothetical protein